MEDDERQEANSSSHGWERSECECEYEGSRVTGVKPRMRWSPKAEQIQILESIFNSGMVNPPKEDTTRITKLLQKFGTVGDANVFYWFQNRRSRSRRRHRQMLQAQAQEHQRHDHQLIGNATTTTLPCDHLSDPINPSISDSASAALVGFGASSSSYQAVQQQPMMDAHAFFSLSADHHMGFPKINDTSSASTPTSLVYPTDHDASNFNYLPGYITVFINGVATEAPMGPMHIKTMFGEDVMLVHSSGVPLPTNEFGFLIQDLQHGESYFLVSKPT